MKKVCSYCLNDQTVKNISFSYDQNQQLICNYCQEFNQIKPKLLNLINQSDYFEKLVKTPHHHRYDIAVGFSGGKDSAYVLTQLVEKYHLKVKAYTLDNGFLATDAVERIKAFVKQLGVDHEFVFCDHQLFKKVYRSLTRKYLSPCIACSYLGYAMMVNYASKVDAKWGIHGRSPYQMLRYYQLESDDPFVEFINCELQISNQDQAEVVNNSLKKISRYVDQELADQINQHLLNDLTTKGYRPFLAYFLYHRYDQKAIYQFLEKYPFWSNQIKEHDDCLIHHYTTYLKDIIAGRPHVLPEISVMIRLNDLSYQEGKVYLEQLKNQYQLPLIKQEAKLFKAYSGLSPQLLILKARLYRLFK